MQCYYSANMTYEVISKELNEAWPILIQLLLHLTDPIELLNTVRQKQKGTNLSLREHIYTVFVKYTHQLTVHESIRSTLKQGCLAIKLVHSFCR